MNDVHAEVDRHVAWMAGPGRPSPQRTDEEDGASAEFHVNGTLICVFAPFEGDTEIYCLSTRGITLFDYTVAPGQDLTEPGAREHVELTLAEMGKQVRFPAEDWRTQWPAA